MDDEQDRLRRAVIDALSPVLAGTEWAPPDGSTTDSPSRTASHPTGIRLRRRQVAWSYDFDAHARRHDPCSILEGDPT